MGNPLTPSPLNIEHRLQQNLIRLIREGRKSLLPPPNILVSDHADATRILPQTSAEPGKWRTKRAPHSRGIMNAVNKHCVRQITVMGSSQIAKTEIILNIVNYKIDVDPCSIMIMQPTDTELKAFVTQKLDPMLEDSKNLRKKISRKKSRDSNNSTYSKKFIGGWINNVSGQSESSTRMRSAKLTIGDDIDAIPLTTRSEGDQISRLMKRSTTYPDSLNINISTPTREGTSRIAALYAQSNMKKYHVRCPHCNEQQLLLEEQLDWDKDVDLFQQKVLKHYPETVRYVCEKCGALINEQERLDMLADGVWIAERPHVTAHEGFFLNELSSTLSSMKAVAKQIVDAGLDIKDGHFDYTNAKDEDVESLFNTVFGRTYSAIRGESIEAIEVMDRMNKEPDYITKEDQTLPNDILLLTTSVDVQEGGRGADQRLEINVWGWGEDEEGWLIFRDVFPGNIKDYTNENSPWKKLDKFFETKWKCKDGVQLPQLTKFVDSGDGNNTQIIYDYCARRHGEGIYAIKGASKFGADLLPRKMSPVNKGKTMLLVLGTQAAKAVIYGRIKNVLTPGPRYFHYPRCYCDANYFKQYAAEQAVTKYTQYTTYVVFEKKKKNEPNENIDLHVYAYCAMKMLNPNWKRLKERRKIQELQINQEQLFEAPAVQQPPKQPRQPVYGKPRKNFANSW